MKKIILLFVAFFPFCLTAQDCLEIIDTTFVCGFQYQLPNTNTQGNWEYLCDLNGGTIAYDYSINGDTTTVTVEECGIYSFSFAANSTDCPALDTLTIFFDDPSSSHFFGSFGGSLEFNDYGCHGGGQACSDGGQATISLAGATPPTVNWDFTTQGGCSATNYLTEAINEDADGCIAEDIIVISTNSGDMDTVFWTASEEYVLEEYWDIYDSLFVNLLDSLSTSDCQIFEPGCPSICVDNPEMDGDSVYIDTIYQIIPYSIGSPGWSIRIGNIDTLLTDTTLIELNSSVTLRFIMTPGADYYGPGNISCSLDQQFISGMDTLYGGIQQDYFPEIYWQELFEYDTLIDIRTYTIPDAICMGCGGSSTSFGGELDPEPPVFNCPAVPLAFFAEGCFCNPPFIDAVVYDIINCNNPCTDVEFYGNFFNGSIEIFGPNGQESVLEDRYTACESGFYEAWYFDFNGCPAYTSFFVNGDFEEFSSEFDAQVCEGECYDWNGQEYCQSGSHEQTLNAVRNGCDSIVTLNLLITPMLEMFDYQEVCAGETYQGLPPGEYQNIIQDQCLVENLLIIELPPAQPNFESAIVCEGECYFFMGETFCDTGTFTVTTTDPNGCIVDNYLELYQENIPTATAFVSNEINCSQESATISIAGDFASIFWSNGSSSPDITVSSGGLYTAEIFSANGCSNQISAVVNELTENTETFQTESICPGETYDGYEAGDYTIESDMGNGCMNILYLTVVENTVTNTEENFNICAGDCIDWNGMTLCQSGTYTNTVEENGCVANQILNLEVEIAPSIEISASNDLDCDNTTATLSVPVQSGSFLWSTGETGNSIVVEDAGDYSVTFISENGCNVQSATSVTDNSESSNISEILYICPGECITVDGQEVCADGIYTYTENSGTCETVYTTEVRQMYAEITPSIVPSLDCDNNQGTLYLSFNTVWCAFLEFEITYPDGTVQQTTEMPLVTNVTQGGTMNFVGYYYSANGSTCETYLSLEIPDNTEEIEISTGEIQEISCLTGYAQPTTTLIDGYEYAWSGPGITSDNSNEVNPQIADAGTYNVEVTNPVSGCSGIAQFVVLPQPEVEIETAIEQAISCQTGFVQPQTTVFDDYNYLWTGAGINPQNESQINPELSTVGLYNVQVTNPANGCSGTAMFTALEMPQISASAEVEPTCEDISEGQINVNNVTGTAPFLYSLDGENWQTEATFTELEADDYAIQIQDADNCSTEVNATINTLATLPEIAPSITEFELCGEEIIALDPEITTANDVQFLWSTGETSSTINASLAGDYEVEISNSCATETIDFTVTAAKDDPMNFVYIPNAFAPRGAVENRIFKGNFGKEVSDYQLRVYDRWGNIIYVSTDFNTGWDGTKKGQNLTTGVYIWQMSFSMEGCDEAIERLELSGDVFLMR